MVIRRQDEGLSRTVEEISGLREDLGVVLTQITSSLATHEQTTTRLERNFNGFQLSRGYSRNRSSSSLSLPYEMLPTAFRTDLTRRYWFGLLNIASTMDMAWRSNSGRYGETDAGIPPLYIEFSFLPPSWVSDTFISIVMGSSMKVIMNRVQVNQNPALLKCLKACDIEGLKGLFSQGKAKPTDLLLDNMAFDFDVGYPKSIMAVGSI
jgi:hypothetical protein